ncbi:hypothetical protein SAMN05216550_117123 [Paraburkholderia tropica]|uniref:Uncharacterized protein n=1 Tax=Paraburkholderia tropica TaxID=92647 RepID=A0AAQ1GLB0_9BURK|nr:hypothetical protein SAMN05216550_117123 [Paraburkholderia tropica]
MLRATSAMPPTISSKRARHVEPRARRADLAVIEEDRARRAFDRALRIAVVEHDHGALAAEFERNALQIARALLADDAAHFGRAGERDLVDVRMAHECCARRLALAGDDVEHARRKARFVREFGETDRGERRFLRGFEHDGAAARERGRDLPHGHQQRKIPRHDGGDHARGHATRGGVVAHARRKREREIDRAAFDLGRPARHVTQPLHAAAHFQHFRKAQQFALIERFERGEFVAVLLDEIGELEQQTLACGGRQASPRIGFEGAARGAHGCVDVGVAGVGNLRDFMAGGRIEHGEMAAVAALDKASVDEHLRADRVCEILAVHLVSLIR